jgi:cytochrome P450
MHLKLDPFGKGVKARAKVFKALENYFKDVPEDVSQLVRERRRVLEDGGISQEDALKMQAFLNDGNFNIFPMLYWAIYDVFSRPQLLEDIRREVMANAVQRSQADAGFVLDMSAVKTKCPLLLGAYQETQRTRHMLPNSRVVLEDTIVDGKYLLKKGRLLFLPTRPIHRSTEIWGSRAAEFDPRRFMADASGPNPLPSHFLPWGTAPYICPARQFVSAGILVQMALIVLRMDLAPAGGRRWEDEPATQWLEIATLPTAREKMDLIVTPRAEGAGKWSVCIGTPKTAVPIKSR